MDKLLSLMGLCRRAGRLGVGHDAVFDAVRRGRARVVILTSDASARALAKQLRERLADDCVQSVRVQFLHGFTAFFVAELAPDRCADLLFHDSTSVK